MYYTPKYFTPQEMFSKAIWDRELSKGNAIWRLLDSRLLITADLIREHFCGTKRSSSIDVMTVNNWSWGGRFQYRGYRDIELDILILGNKFSKTSQHCFGRGLDYHFNRTTAEEVQQDILKYPQAERYQFITGLEIGTSWVHNDFRCWDKTQFKILTFRP